MKGLLAEYTSLIEKLERWNHAYFVLDSPLISDQEYDRHLKRLEEIESQNPQLMVPYSPTRKIGGALLEKFEKGAHSYRLMSLSNVFSEEEFLEFVNRIRKILSHQGSLDFYAETKFDGLSVALRYEEGTLVEALTRGDGAMGENVTENILTIRSIPLRIKESESLVLRAEVLMPKQEFARLNEEQEALGKKIFANPRNAAAGTIRQLDTAITSSRKLDAYFYEIMDRERHSYPTHSDAMRRLQKLGFKIDPRGRLCQGEQDVLNFYEELRSLRPDLDYDIDGIVVKLNRFEDYDELGVTGKAPRYAIAFKYEAEQAQTTVINIAVQVGRTGVLTPVAEFKPVFLAGSTVRFASLHNWDEIRQKDIRIGDEVLIEKAGDIIPQVVSVLLDLRSIELPSFPQPSTCPLCESDVQKREGEVAYRCENPNCDSRVLGALKHFVSRDAVDIQGVGSAILEQLLRRNLVKIPMDLFSLSLEQLLGLEKTKEKLAKKIVDAVQLRRKIPFNRYLYALGIPNVGVQGAGLLASSFSSMEKLCSASEEELSKIDEIGPIMALSLKTFFNSEFFQSMEKRRLELGIVLEIPKEVVIGGSLTGLSLCFTGTLERMPRSAAQELAMSNGASIHKSVTAKTSVLVFGDSAGSKLDKARKLGLELWPEDEFFRRIEYGNYQEAH